MPSILDAFNEFFEMVPAVSPALLHEVYKLRYQVYCIETGFETPDNHPDQMEYDEFDENSVHYLVRHKRTGVYAASTRLILPDLSHLEHLFPIEIHSKIENTTVLQNVPRDKLGEVSRFCVSKEFKRRKNEEGTLNGFSESAEDDHTEDERRTFPHITIALITCLVKISVDHRVDWWYAVMEPALLRFLSTLGIRFTQLGPITDYHGRRQPGIIKVRDLLDGVNQKNPGLWQMLTMDGAYNNHF